MTTTAGEPRPFIVHRRWAALAVLLVVAELVLLVLVVRFAPAPKGPAEPPHPTLWQAITSGIKDDQVPTATALEAFAYLYRIDIPGVTLPNAPEGGDAPRSASGAIRWVQQNWPKLTPQQQAIVASYVGPGPNDTVIHVDATRGATSTGPSPAAATAAIAGAGAPVSARTARFDVGTLDRPGAVVAAVARPTSRTPAAPPAAPSDLTSAMGAELVKDIQHIGERLGLPVIDPGTGPFWKKVTLTLSDKDGGNTDMTTFACSGQWEPTGCIVYPWNEDTWSPCNIVVYRNRWTGQGVNNGAIPDVLRVQLTHEVVHCYQNVIWASTDVALAMPAWITEGTALWLAADDTQIQEPIIPSMWSKGYFVPELPLTNRSYDAFGYYALLSHLGRDLWGLMVPAWKAAAASAQRSNAFIAVLNGDADDVRDGWAPSYTRHDSWGDPWIAYGFGLPSDAEAFPHPVLAEPEPGWTGSLPGRSNTVTEVDGSGWDVVQVDTSGKAAVHDDSGDTALAFTTARFCVGRSDCICPKNTARAGQDMAPNHLESQFTAVFNAGFGGSTWDVIGYKLEDLCGRQETPRPGQQGGGCDSCGGSNGDPHIKSLNGYRYEFQAAGEFTLLRSTDSSLEVQAREEPYGESGQFQVAINTAVAARVNGHRVVVTSANGLQLKVDGSAADASSPVDLGNGGSVRSVAKGYQVTFPDGTQLWALSVGQWGINAEVLPSSSLRTSGQGLLGRVVPGGQPLPALPDGTRLPVAINHHDRFVATYGRFADAWRVTDSTTLFDYDAGQSTATFTDRSFPTEEKDLDFTRIGMGPLADAGSACGSVSDPGLQLDCVYDVIASGDTGFAESYVAVQAFYAGGAQSPTPTPTSSLGTPGPTASFVAPSFTVTGATKVTEVGGIRSASMGTDGILYVSIQPLGSQAGRILAVNVQDGSVAHQVDISRPTDIHYAGGSVFAADVEDEPGKGCTVSQYSATDLTHQAVYPVPCDFFGDAIVRSTGSEIFYLDVTKVDSDGKGATLRLLKTASGAGDVAAPVPFLGGYFQDSQGTIFYADSGKDAYRLSADRTSLEDLGSYGFPIYPAGTGFWVQDQGGQTASFHDRPGGPTATVPIDGAVVGGDPQAVYLDVFGQGAIDSLVRQPADGSAGTQLAVGPTVDDQQLGYFNDFPKFATPTGFVQLWLPGSGGLSSRALYIQFAPLP